ncbi:hypothetical protein HYALB_00004832 [Hymenoscyphus albidus]|uniref:Berberine/berberine-like domain-containing protein n=1 Tax=Hymenoscyphus albidus TaxID=595503 RepID=A0A9N9M0Q4_9HELO|nr:hypothetical protein HYALB_00004832 [Hymenoscyphus albidus]
MISIGYSAAVGPQIMCLNQPYFTDAMENPPVLDPFTKIEPQIGFMNTMRLHTLKEAAEEQAGAHQRLVRCAYMNMTVKADVPTLQRASNIHTAEIDHIDEHGYPKDPEPPIRSVENGLFSLTLQPYSLSLLEKSASNGGNSLGLNTNDGPLVSILLMSIWKNETDDDVVLDFMRNTIKHIKLDAEERYTLVPYVYMNYAFSHQDPIGSYGVENHERLQAASKKYDPEGLFQRPCPGGFKLFT